MVSVNFFFSRFGVPDLGSCVPNIQQYSTVVYTFFRPFHFFFPLRFLYSYVAGGAYQVVGVCRVDLCCVFELFDNIVFILHEAIEKVVTLQDRYIHIQDLEHVSSNVQQPRFGLLLGGISR